jgi:hypothetical protein
MGCLFHALHKDPSIAPSLDLVPAETWGFYAPQRAPGPLLCR